MSPFQDKLWILGFFLSLVAYASWKQFKDVLQFDDELSIVYFIRLKHGYKEDVKVYSIEPNCGIRHQCPDNSFAIYLSTGTPKNNRSKLCVSGKHVIHPRTQFEGRGLNGAIVESNNFQVVSVRNFDTFLYNKSVEIAKWLDGMIDDDILILFTTDEASVKLDVDTKYLLNELGSGKVHNLQYRSQWYMITQKGSVGFTVYEKITYSKKKAWGDTIEFRGCIPRKIPKKPVTADEPLKENKKKVQFCEGKKLEKYKGFCNEPRYEILMPALLTNKSLIGNVAYFYPLFLYASENLEVLTSSLDNIIHQPGIVLSMVTVLYESHQTDVPGLARAYGMHSNKTVFAKTFEGKMEQARNFSKKLHPKKEYLIVLDADVIPSPDFLFFFAQTHQNLEKDKSVIGISAWNSNCYSHQGNVHLIYRIIGTPKYGALIPSYSQNKMFHGEIYAPDVSRVQGLEVCHLPSLEPNNWIERPQDLIKDRYIKKLIMLQQLSHEIDVKEFLNNCSTSALQNYNNVIYLSNRESKLPKVLICLGIIDNHYGEFDGIIRISIEEKEVLVITKESSLYKSRPIVNKQKKLTKGEMKTSTQIGLPYSPERTVLYEKQPRPRIPIIRMNNPYKVNFVYTPKQNFVSTTKDSYTMPTPDPRLGYISSSAINPPKEYSKFGKNVRPIPYGETEYGKEYQMKDLPPGAQGLNVERVTTCPMVTIGRDEREPLPLTANYNKYLDIYLSETRLAHRAFTVKEQTSIGMKDIVTTYETLDIPKGRGFGCKFPCLAGQDLDKRDTNMIDKMKFPQQCKMRRVKKPMDKVPNFGGQSETQAAFKKPEGTALKHLFDRFLEFPQPVIKSSTRQDLSPPGMYTTETYAINYRRSPQMVV